MKSTNTQAISECQQAGGLDMGAALRRAFNLGQTYWQQADSEYISQHRKADETFAKFEALIVEALTMLPVAADDGTAAFKNFHRSLCDRFGYTHDERDWRRDRVSLEEWIVKQIATPQERGFDLRHGKTVPPYARAGQPVNAEGSYYAADGTLMNADGTRSIFDDVDEGDEPCGACEQTGYVAEDTRCPSCNPAPADAASLAAQDACKHCGVPDGFHRIDCAQWAGPSVAELMALLPGTYYMDPPDGGSVTLLEQLQRMARDAEAYRRINTPELHDFMEGMRNEALHQVERWGQAHDRSKSAENWYWLVGYLAGKALRAAITGDRDKALHHTISSAAALANWHAAILADTTGTGVGEDADLRPASYPAHGEPGALEQGEPV